MRVLIVDDSMIVTKMMSQFLTSCGYTVDTSNSPFGVSNRIRETQPDLILMDLGLPGLSGESLLSLARKGGEGAGPKMVIISTNVEEMRDLVAKGLADDFFVKGSPLHELEAKIRALFRHSLSASLGPL